MCFPSIRLHHPSAISKGNRFTADSVRQTHGGLLCFRPRDTTSLYFFFPFADLKDFVSPGQRKNSSGRGRGRKAARGKRKRRPLVLEGADLTSSWGQRQQLSCLTDSDEAADFSASWIIPLPILLLLLFLLLCSHLDFFSQRGDSSS